MARQSSIVYSLTGIIITYQKQIACQTGFLG